MNDIISRIIRFGIVGCTGIIIDFSVTWLGKEKLRINKFAANAAGFAAAVINNYLLNRIWTFKNNDPAVIKQFVSFMLIAIIGLLLNTAILYLLNEKKKYPFYRSKLAAIAFVFCWNFVANSMLTFAHG